MTRNQSISHRDRNTAVVDPTTTSSYAGQHEASGYSGISPTRRLAPAQLDVEGGSADGTTWGAKSLVAFPQKFYCEESPLLLDLTGHPDVKYVRAHWEVARWGRGTETPMFEFGLRMKEVPSDILKEATAEARARA